MFLQFSYLTETQNATFLRWKWKTYQKILQPKLTEIA